MNVPDWLKRYQADFFATLLLLLCLLVMDWVWHLPEQQNKADRNLPELGSWQQIKTDKHPVAPMINAFQQSFYKPDESSTQSAEGPVIDGLSLAEQQAQQGLVRHLYIENKRYSLHAILSKQNGVAVLQEEQLSTGESKTISRSELQTLGPYSVKSLKDNRITLEANGRIVWLKLFQPTSQTKDTE